MTTPYLEQDPVFSSSGVLTFTRQNHEDMDIFSFDGENSTTLAGGDGDQIRPIWSGNQLIFFSNARGEAHWDILITTGDAPPQTLASDVRLPVRAAPALTADGQWLAYGSTDPERSNAIEFVRCDGSQRTTFQTGHISPGEPALMHTADRIWLAYTARSTPDSERRSLHIADVTAHLSSPGSAEKSER